MFAEKHRAKIEEIVAETMPEAFILSQSLKKGPKSTLFIKVDTDTGISLDACASISRAIGRWLEEEDVFSFPYQLEVSSPGVGAPLKLFRQYRQNIGRKLQLQLEDGEEVKGILVELEEEHSIFLEAIIPKHKGKKKKKAPAWEGRRKVEFNHIKSAKVIVGI